MALFIPPLELYEKLTADTILIFAVCCVDPLSQLCRQLSVYHTFVLLGLSFQLHKDIYRQFWCLYANY